MASLVISNNSRQHNLDAGKSGLKLKVPREINNTYS